MMEEMESLHKNETWVLVKRPKGKRTVRCKWAYRKKEGIPEVEDARFKARLIVTHELSYVSRLERRYNCSQFPYSV